MYNRERRRIAAWGMRLWGGSRLQSWAAAVGERYGRMAVQGGSGRSMGCVKAAERLGRIGAMWLGAERARVWAARAEGWVGGSMDVRSGGWLGVWCGIADGVCGDAGCGVVWCGVLVCGDGSMWTWGW